MKTIALIAHDGKKADMCRRQIDSGQVVMVCYHGQL